MHQLVDRVKSENVDKKALVADTLAYLNQTPASTRAEKYSIIVCAFVYL